MTYWKWSRMGPNVVTFYCCLSIWQKPSSTGLFFIVYHFLSAPPRTHALLEIFDGSRGWRIIGSFKNRASRFSSFPLPLVLRIVQRLGTRQSRGCLDGLTRAGITAGASKHPLLTKPKIKMDWKLKKLAQLFQVLLLCLQKSTKDYYGQCCLLNEMCLISSMTLKEYFVYRFRSQVMTLAKSTWHIPLRTFSIILLWLLII